MSRSPSSNAASTCTPSDEIELMGDVNQLPTGKLLSTRGKPLSQRDLIDLGPAVKFSIDRMQDILDQIALSRWILAINGVHHPIGASGSEDPRTCGNQVLE